MLTPSTATVADYNAAVFADAPYHIRITFLTQGVVLEDGDVVLGGFDLQSIINPDTDLTVGKALMDEINLQIINSSKISDLVWDQEFKLEFGLDVNNTTDWVTIGYYTGQRPDRIRNVRIIDYTAHDRMGRFDIAADRWVKSLRFPMTVSQIYTSLCNYVGIEIAAGNELSAIMSRSYSSSPITNTGVMCRDVLSAIAEACGCYARINSAGKVQMKWFSDQTSYVIDASDQFDIDHVEIDKVGKTWEELESDTWQDLEQLRWEDIEGYNIALQINSITVKQTEDDIGVSYPSQTLENNYLIIDNPFLSITNNTELNNYLVPLYTRLNTFGGYVPMNVNAVGNCLVEVGDIVSVTIDGTNYRLPIFTRTMEWNGAIRDTYESTGNVKREPYTQQQREKLTQGAKYHKFRNDLNELYSELYDPESGDISILNQNAGQFELKLQNKYEMQSGIDITPDGIEITGGKYIKILAGNEIDIESGGSLNIKANADMTIKNGGSLSIQTGGTFDLDSENFKISSAYKMLKSGDFTVDEEGFKIDDTVDVENYGNVNLHFIVSNLAEASFSSTDFYSGILYNTELYYGNLGLLYRPEIILFSKAGTATSGYPFSVHIGSTDYENVCIYEESANATLALGDPDHPVNAYAYGVIPTASGEYTDTHVGANANRFTYGYFTNLYYDTVNSNSSRDIKHDIKPMETMGDVLDLLKPVTFVYNNDKSEKKRYGLIYEDTLPVLPDICSGDGENKAINYLELVPMMLKEIQELRKRVMELERRG